jgi:hypothetical protein
VLVWDNSNTHVSRAMRKLTAARSWLTVFQLPAYASELNPVESPLQPPQFERQRLGHPFAVEVRDDRISVAPPIAIMSPGDRPAALLRFEIPEPVHRWRTAMLAAPRATGTARTAQS